MSLPDVKVGDRVRLGWWWKPDEWFEVRCVVTDERLSETVLMGLYVGPTNLWPSYISLTEDVEIIQPPPKRYVVEMRKPKKGETYIAARFSGQNDAKPVVKDPCPPDGIRAVIVEELS